MKLQPRILTVAEQALYERLGDLRPYEAGLDLFINANPERIQAHTAALTNFLKDVDALRQHNQLALTAEQKPVTYESSLQDIFLKYVPVFQLEPLNDLDERTAEIAISAMNDLATHALDTAAPQVTQDTDSYEALHHPDREGGISRLNHNIQEFNRRIIEQNKNNSAFGYWLKEAQKHGKMWNVSRNKRAIEQEHPIAQSFEWRRRRDGALIRKIAMGRVLDSQIRHHNIALNLNVAVGRKLSAAEENKLMSALNKLGNMEQSRRLNEIVEVVSAMQIALADDAKKRVGQELLRFLDETDSTHAQLLLQFMDHQAASPAEIALRDGLFRKLDLCCSELYLALSQALDAEPGATATLIGLFEDMPHLLESFKSCFSIKKESGFFASIERLARSIAEPKAPKSMNEALAQWFGQLEAAYMEGEININDLMTVEKIGAFINNELITGPVYNK